MMLKKMNKKEAQAMFSQFIAIHITSYFPKGGIIRTRYATKPFTWLRDTAHFSLNAPAPDLSAFQAGGRSVSWSNEKFAILIPFTKLYAHSEDQLQSIG
jgi:allantoicase